MLKFGHDLMTLILLRRVISGRPVLLSKFNLFGIELKGRELISGAGRIKRERLTE